MTTRKGKNINTYMGVEFYPLDPRKEEVKIEDIAHALSMMCRGNGHVKFFFTVGQHSVNCAKEAAARGYSIRVQLACLLHDASEAYMSDVTRPVKAALSEYLVMEEKLQTFIYESFGLADISKEEQDQIDSVDDTMLAEEMKALFTVVPDHVLAKDYTVAYEGLEVAVEEIPAVKAAFLDLFEELSSKL